MKMDRLYPAVFSHPANSTSIAWFKASASTHPPLMPELGGAVLGDIVRTRLIEQGDIDQCAEVFVGVFNSASWKEGWDTVEALTRLEALYKTPGFHGVLAEESSKVFGFAMGRVEQWSGQRKQFYLEEMCVESSHQRRGIGTAIMQALCRELSRLRVEKIYLLTSRDGAAEAFYRRCGFDVNFRIIMMGKYVGENA